MKALVETNSESKGNIYKLSRKYNWTIVETV